MMNERTVSDYISMDTNNVIRQSQFKDELIKEKMKGVVIKYLTERKFGFIRSNDKAVKDDIYFFWNQIVVPQGDNSFRKLYQYQEVTFDLYMSKRGLLAKNVIGGEILTDLLMSQVSHV